MSRTSKYVWPFRFRHIKMRVTWNWVRWGWVVTRLYYDLFPEGSLVRVPKSSFRVRLYSPLFLCPDGSRFSWVSGPYDVDTRQNLIVGRSLFLHTGSRVRTDSGVSLWVPVLKWSDLGRMVPLWFSPTIGVRTTRSVILCTSLHSRYRPHRSFGFTVVKVHDQDGGLVNIVYDGLETNSCSVSVVDKCASRVWQGVDGRGKEKRVLEFYWVWTGFIPCVTNNTTQGFRDSELFRKDRLGSFLHSKKVSFEDPVPWQKKNEGLVASDYKTKFFSLFFISVLTV